MILTIQGTPDLFLDLEPEVTETAAEGLPLRGSQMDATIRDSDGSGKCDLFLSFSPSVSYRQHPSEVHARAAYEAKNFIGWARLALTYPPKLQKRPFFSYLFPPKAGNHPLFQLVIVHSGVLQLFFKICSPFSYKPGVQIIEKGNKFSKKSQKRPVGLSIPRNLP